jgi:hypothetical protein
MVPKGEEDLDITIFKVFLAEQREKRFRTHVSRCVRNDEKYIPSRQPFLQWFFTDRSGKGCGECVLQRPVRRMERFQESGLPVLRQVEGDSPLTAFKRTRHRCHRML